jgi:hypothetical protein
MVYDTAFLPPAYNLPIYPVAPVTRILLLGAVRSADKSGLREMEGCAKDIIVHNFLLQFFNSCIERENTACKLSGVAPATLVGGKDTDNVCMRGSHTFKPPIRTIGRLNSIVADAADRL